MSEHAGFEAFIKHTRPPWLVRLQKDENGMYVNSTTAKFYLAWIMGVGMRSLSDLVSEFKLGDISKDDPHCFAEQNSQRLYWCYQTAVEYANDIIIKNANIKDLL